MTALADGFFADPAFLSDAPEPRAEDRRVEREVRIREPALSLSADRA